jgi:succinate dehydrogenase / fumarate reductase iron-sulfur subunit
VVATDEKYLGPHALLKALRFVEDSRDGATYERLAYVASDEGVFRCHTIFNCQQVCPKDLDPTGAIGKLKMKAFWARMKGKLPKAG